jgi:hypothetical protein
MKTVNTRAPKERLDRLRRLVTAVGNLRLEQFDAPVNHAEGEDLLNQLNEQDGRLAQALLAALDLAEAVVTVPTTGESNHRARRIAQYQRQREAEKAYTRARRRLGEP